MNDTPGGRGLLLSGLMIVSGIGWVYFCCVMGLRCGQEWAEIAIQGWGMVARGFPLVLAGGLMGIIGIMASDQILKGVLYVLGVLIFIQGFYEFLPGVWWIVDGCVRGIPSETWAFLTILGWLAALFGLLKLLTTKFDS